MLGESKREVHPDGSPGWASLVEFIREHSRDQARVVQAALGAGMPIPKDQKDQPKTDWRSEAARDQGTRTLQKRSTDEELEHAEKRMRIALCNWEANKLEKGQDIKRKVETPAEDVIHPALRCFVTPEKKVSSDSSKASPMVPPMAPRALAFPPSSPGSSAPAAPVPAPATLAAQVPPASVPAPAPENAAPLNTVLPTPASSLPAQVADAPARLAPASAPAKLPASTASDNTIPLNTVVPTPASSVAAQVPLGAGLGSSNASSQRRL